MDSARLRAMRSRRGGRGPGWDAETQATYLGLDAESYRRQNELSTLPTTGVCRQSSPTCAASGTVEAAMYPAPAGRSPLLRAGPLVRPLLKPVVELDVIVRRVAVTHGHGHAGMDVELAGEHVRDRVTPVDLLAQRHEQRSEEHTSELQSRQYLVCRLLLEK